MADEMVEAIKLAMTKTVEEKKNGSDDVILLGLLEHIAENASFYKVMIGSYRIPIFQEKLKDIFVQKITEGVAKRPLQEHGIQQDFAIWFGSSAMLGTIVAWLRNDMPYSPQFLARQFALLLRRGDLELFDKSTF